MADNGKRESSCAVEEGHSSESGKEFDPFALRKEDSERGADNDIYIPIGHPISSTEYTALKASSSRWMRKMR